MAMHKFFFRHNAILIMLFTWSKRSRKKENKTFSKTDDLTEPDELNEG